MPSDSLGTFTRKALIILVIAVLAAVAFNLVYLLTLIFAALVLAVMLRAIAFRFIRLKVPEGLAVALAVIALVSGFGAFCWMFGGLVAGQFDALRSQLPTAAEAAQKQLSHWGIRYDLHSLTRHLGDQMEGLFTRASGLLIAAGGVIADVVMVLVGGIFFAAQPAFYRDGALRLVPKEAEGLAEEVLGDCGTGLEQWLKGQILSSACVVALMTCGLLLLGVPSAFALGIIAGVMDFIPFIGPVIAAIPALLLGFSKDPATALWTLILFLIVQQIQGHVLQPMVQKQSVDLPPVVLLFAVLATGILFGAPGIVLAAPLTVVGYILVQHLYIGQVLGREPKRPGQKARGH